MYKVYKYTFPDGKIYIGVTKNTIQYRKDCGYQHNKPLTNAIRKVGFRNICVDVLFETEDQMLAFEKEKILIEEQNARNPKFGYNISAGGKNTFEGLHHTEEHKQKMSNLYKGKNWSNDAIKNMRESHKKERKPVCSVSDDGAIIHTYKSLGEAAEDVGGFKSNISRACMNQNKKYKNVYWKRVEVV